MRGSRAYPASEGVLHVTSTENGEMLERFNICGALGTTGGEECSRDPKGCQKLILLTLHVYWRPMQIKL